MPKPSRKAAQTLADRINADPRNSGRYDAHGLSEHAALGWYAVVADSVSTTAYPHGRALNVHTWTQWEAIVTARPRPMSTRRARPMGRMGARTPRA